MENSSTNKENEQVLNGVVLKNNLDSQEQQVPSFIAAPKLSNLATALIASLEKKDPPSHGRIITVNPVVSKFATWFEKLRNVMEYRDEEVMLRAAIERMLRRMLLLGGNAKTTAAPLVRELMWARYLTESEVSESIVSLVEESIELHLRLRLLVIQRHKLPESELNDLIYQLMSADISQILEPHHIKQIMSNFMFQVLRDDVVILDDNEQTRDAQVYMSIRKAFAKDDLAYLRYHILKLYFGKLSSENVSAIAESFMQGYQELVREMKYPKKERIYSFIKKRTAVFLILEDVLYSNRANIMELLKNQTALERAVFNTCEEKYHSVGAKVRRAIVRSVFFILLTKVIFAILVEGTYELYVYGHYQWETLLINIIVPPLLMLVVSFFFRSPGPDNTVKIYNAIKILLFADKPRLGEVLSIKKQTARPRAIFTILWLFAFLVSFGLIISLLKLLSFNLVSIGIFLFFLAIVSFLSYRISLTANLYRMGERQSIFTPFVDFFFMPVVRVGRELTANISKINILLFIMDFVIEAPFKLLFAFFEQWFVFLHAKREELE